MAAVTRLLVGKSHEGERLDVFLASVTSLSRRAARRLIAEGKVWRNGRATRIVSRRVVAGDVVDVLVPARELNVPPKPQLPCDLDVLFQDRHLIVVAKPSGMLTQPAESSDELTLYEAVLLRLSLEEGHRVDLHLINRLDRGTSGAVVFAIGREAAGRLSKQWQQGDVRKGYLAVVEGQLSEDEVVVDKPLIRSASGQWRFTVGASGRRAVTCFFVLESFGDRSLVLCVPITGRTHQVRVHLEHIGHPVVGDKLYGSRISASRMMLHAWYLSFGHPMRERKVRIESPPPAYFAPYLAGPWKDKAFSLVESKTACRALP